HDLPHRPRRSLTPIRRPPTSPRLPYTTLFRSVRAPRGVRPGRPAEDPAAHARALPRRVDAHALRDRRGDDRRRASRRPAANPAQDRKSTRLNSSHVKISYAVFCLKKKKNYVKLAIALVIPILVNTLYHFATSSMNSSETQTKH